ncbi:DDE superfamily endonuclease [Phytophthora infestans]|uniref:DDE superfamily endonuclease n=1 Tax=Phytophthora infestans TaxID=4787 RepID=A0A8S9TUN7_PHYIN|nr:DDE superfamily endonuclease [Phytophthora infestans]
MASLKHPPPLKLSDMLVDNATSHELQSGELTNITVQKLPPNTTSYLQPMDAGIIAAAKRGYRDRHMSLACDRADKSMPHKAPEGKDIYYVDQLQGMKYVDEAWDDITPETIRHSL